MGSATGSSCEAFSHRCGVRCPHRCGRSGCVHRYRVRHGPLGRRAQPADLDVYRSRCSRLCCRPRAGCVDPTVVEPADPGGEYRWAVGCWSDHDLGGVVDVYLVARHPVRHHLDCTSHSPCRSARKPAEQPVVARPAPYLGSSQDRGRRRLVGAHRY